MSDFTLVLSKTPDLHIFEFNNIELCENIINLLWFTQIYKAVCIIFESLLSKASASLT